MLPALQPHASPERDTDGSLHRCARGRQFPDEVVLPVAHRLLVDGQSTDEESVRDRQDDLVRELAASCAPVE